MPCERSTVVAIAPSTAWSKLGQPVPLSNFVSDENSTCPQAAHRNWPARFSRLRGLDPRLSVPWHRSTWYWLGDRTSCHSVSERSTWGVSFWLIRSFLSLHQPTAFGEGAIRVSR